MGEELCSENMGNLYCSCKERVLERAQSAVVFILMPSSLVFIRLRLKKKMFLKNIVPQDDRHFFIVNKIFS